MFFLAICFTLWSKCAKCWTRYPCGRFWQFLWRTDFSFALPTLYPKWTGWQILKIFVTNRFTLCGHPLQTTLPTHLDHSKFCPKLGVPQTSIVISCQFLNISKENYTIDIAFFFLLYVLRYDRNVRNAEQDNRVADFENFCDELISPMRGHPFTRNVRNAEQDNWVADCDNFCDE